jgi:hypothetical protein
MKIRILFKVCEFLPDCAARSGDWAVGKISRDFGYDKIAVAGGSLLFEPR